MVGTLINILILQSRKQKIGQGEWQSLGKRTYLLEVVKIDFESQRLAPVWALSVYATMAPEREKWPRHPEKKDEGQRGRVRYEQPKEELNVDWDRSWIWKQTQRKQEFRFHFQVGQRLNSSVFHLLWSSFMTLGKRTEYMTMLRVYCRPIQGGCRNAC